MATWKPNKDVLLSKKTILFVILFAIVGAALLIFSLAAPPPIPWKNDAYTSVESINGEIEAMGQAVRSDGSRKGNVAKTLLVLSQQRQGLMENLIKSNPDAASSLMLGDANLANLGGITGSKLEKKVTLTGMYYIRAEDGKPETPTLVVNGTEFSIFTNGSLPDIPIEADVSITGYQFGNNLFIPTYLKNPITKQVKVNSPSAQNQRN